MGDRTRVQRTAVGKGWTNASLKTRITLFTLSLFLLGIWSLALYASRVQYRELQGMVSEQEYATVSLLAAEIDKDLELRLRALEDIAARISPAMVRHTPSLKAFIESRLVLFILFNGGVFVTGMDGRTLVDYPRSAGRVGINYGDRAWMAQALRGETAIGQPVVGVKLGAPLFPLAVPVRDPAGRVIGVVVGVVDLSRPNFLDQVTGHRYGKTGGYALIAPQHGRVVTATDRRLVMQPAPAPGVDPLYDRFAAGFEGSGMTVDAQGERVLASAKGVPAAGWILVGQIPTAEAFAPVRSALWRVVWATLLLTLLAGVLMWWFLKRQLAPAFDTMKTLTALAEADHPNQTLAVTRGDEIGALIGGFNQLLSSLRQKEETQRHAYRLMSDIIQHNPTAIAVLDREMRYLYVSQRYLDDYGVGPQTVIGRSHYEVFPDLPQRWREVHQQALAGAILRAEEEAFPRADGTLDWVRWECRPWSEADGTIGGIVLYTEVITARKRAEEERESLQRQLMQAQKMEAIGTLAGGIAHDFNNILGAISGYTEIALTRIPAESRVKHYLEQIQISSQRAIGLVRQILTFSRQTEQKRGAISLTPLLKESVRMLREMIPATIEIRLQIQTPEDRVLGDATQLHQILMNLCVNAYQAMREKGGALEITLVRLAVDGDADGPEPWRGLTPGPYLELSVRDTGEGIDPLIVERIFDPFFTTKKIGEGTGLGLSVVHGIVGSYRGRVAVESHVGAGSTFRVYLPLLLEAPKGEVREAALPEGEGRGRILLVDDEAMLANVLKELLEGRGYTVVSRTDSRLALEAFCDAPAAFDLVVTDQVMPQLTGVELSARLRALRPELPVLLCTGVADAALEEKAAAAGVAAVLTKPVQLKRLLAIIQRLLAAEPPVPVRTPSPASPGDPAGRKRGVAALEERS